VPGVRPQLQHDGAQDLPRGVIDRGQDLADAIMTQGAERLAVVRGVGEEPARLVGRYPQIADLGQLGGRASRTISAEAAGPGRGVDPVLRVFDTGALYLARSS